MENHGKWEVAVVDQNGDLQYYGIVDDQGNFPLHPGLTLKPHEALVYSDLDIAREMKKPRRKDGVWIEMESSPEPELKLSPEPELELSLEPEALVAVHQDEPVKIVAEPHITAITYKYACIVDIRDIYQDIVLVHIIPQPDGTTKDEIQFYTLKPGERLIDTKPPTRRPHAGAEGLVRSRWDGQAWEEAATADEIKQWELEHPAPPVEPHIPTTEERLAASEQQLTDMQMALAESYEYSDTQNTNTQLALVEVYELLAATMEGGVSSG